MKNISDATAARIQHYRRTFGDNLKQRRKELKLFQRQLAEATSLDQPYISAIEGGRVNAGIDLLVIICEAVGMSLPEMLTQQPSTTPISSSDHDTIRSHLTSPDARTDKRRPK
ncbi:MAG: helix-turn-helix transcriptional regulator [Magnetospirillum sp.]|nr:helix-turn-helix transcriptional regulator [Magnetospirillum sp.]